MLAQRARREAEAGLAGQPLRPRHGVSGSAAGGAAGSGGRVQIIGADVSTHGEGDVALVLHQPLSGWADQAAVGVAVLQQQHQRTGQCSTPLSWSASTRERTCATTRLTWWSRCIADWPGTGGPGRRQRRFDRTQCAHNSVRRRYARARRRGSVKVFVHDENGSLEAITCSKAFRATTWG